MSFFDKMERKFGKYAIKNLMKYIIILYGIGFIMNLFDPRIYTTYFCLDPQAIMRGEVWRIFTFLLFPPSDSLIFIIFSMYLYYLLGNTLERYWGAFRFNLYYLTGVIGTVLGSMILYGITGTPYLMTTYYINMSLFLAFATLVPDMQLLLFFVIPIKIKWLAYLDVLLLVYSCIMGDWGIRVSIILALINFLIYFLTYMRRRKSPRQMYRQHNFKKAAAPKATANITRHKCAVCGRTEKDDESLEFRFCSKCNGNYEYCQDHLFTHEHIK